MPVEEKGLTSYPAKPAKSKSKLDAKVRRLICRMCRQEFELEIKRGPVRQYCDACRPARSRELHGSMRRQNRVQLMRSELKPLVAGLVHDVLAEAGLLPHKPDASGHEASNPKFRGLKLVGET